MRGQLGVRIRDGFTDRHVTKHVSGLKFRKTAPGGHADASCQLTLPRNTFSDLGPADRIWIYDARTAETLWEGYTTNPGTRSGRDGEGFDLSALGGQSRLSDAANRLVYLDTSLTSWVQDTESPQAPSATAQTGDGPDGSGTLQGTPGMFLQFNPQHPAGSGYLIGLMYTGMVGSEMTVGGLIGQYDGGVNSGGLYEVFWYGSPSPTLYLFDVLNTGVTPLAIFAGGAHLDTGKPRVKFEMQRTGPSTNVPDDTVWAFTGTVTVVGQLVDRYGADLNMATTVYVSMPDAWLYSHQIVEDLLGRVLTFCDPETAIVEATSSQIDQFAYPDGVKPGQVLDDLAEFEADMLYEVLETNSAGLHRFNYRAWPTTSRYVIPASVPVTQPGSDMDLCNRVLVTFTDAKGQPQVIPVTSFVPALGSRIRDADPITLPEGRGSAANAALIGAQVLASKAAPPAAATVTVNQRIQDRLRGRWVQPWEIEPGYLVRLTATGQDLRLTEVAYDDDTCSATLTLGDPVQTPEQRIARLDRAS